MHDYGELVVAVSRVWALNVWELEDCFSDWQECIAKEGWCSKYILIAMRMVASIHDVRLFEFFIVVRIQPTYDQAEIWRHSLIFSTTATSFQLP